LESPPRTTGNAQQDFPIMIDWFYRAYQVIVQAVNYINQQVDVIEPGPGTLPDPGTATVATAQETANLAYLLAFQANTNANDAIETIGRFDSGVVNVADPATGATVTLSPAQPDTNYSVFIQPKSITGAPAAGAYVVTGKTYNTGDFSFTISAAPGGGNAVSFDWQLIRKT
jgi:hypothetical protein